MVWFSWMIAREDLGPEDLKNARRSKFNILDFLSLIAGLSGQHIYFKFAVLDII